VLRKTSVWQSFLLLFLVERCISELLEKVLDYQTPM
jgi:hypothetical protein